MNFFNFLLIILLKMTAVLQNLYVVSSGSGEWLFVLGTYAVLRQDQICTALRHYCSYNLL